jgi:hypothetical protein
MTCKTLKTAVLAALALTTLGTVTLHARDSSVLLKRGISNVQAVPMTNGPVAIMKLKFNCVVAGSPTEFPNDIAISHNYNFTVPAGTLVAYTAPFGNSGTVALPALAPGKYFFLSNVIPGGGPAGAPCTASQI